MRSQIGKSLDAGFAEVGGLAQEEHLLHQVKPSIGRHRFEVARRRHARAAARLHLDLAQRPRQRGEHAMRDVEVVLEDILHVVDFDLERERVLDRDGMSAARIARKRGEAAHRALVAEFLRDAPALEGVYGAFDDQMKLRHRFARLVHRRTRREEALLANGREYGELRWSEIDEARKGLKHQRALNWTDRRLI